MIDFFLNYFKYVLLIYLLALFKMTQKQVMKLNICK